MGVVMSDGKHQHACEECGRDTYRKGPKCRYCEPYITKDGRSARVPGRPPMFPNPATFPEDYLMECARELLRRHKERGELLRAVMAEAA